MVSKRYGIPFIAALVVNLAYWGVVGDLFGHLKPPETPKKDLVINLDMAQPEPPEQEKKQQEKMVSDDKENAAGGKSGSVLPDLSGKPTAGLHNLNPFLGGNEPAPVNLMVIIMILWVIQVVAMNKALTMGQLAMVEKQMTVLVHRAAILELVIRKVQGTLMFRGIVLV